MKIMPKIFLGFALLMILNGVGYAQGVPDRFGAAPTTVPAPVPVPAPQPGKPTDPPCDIVDVLPLCAGDTP